MKRTQVNKAMAALALVITGCFGAVHAAEPVQRQPVLDVNFPDPFVLVTKDGLAAYATNGGVGNRHLNVQFSRSADGLTWSAPVDAMPRTPSWARRYGPDIWAPEVMKIGDKYVMYFSARHARKLRPDGLTLCVGAAVADAPEGPFRPQSEPLTCGGDIGAIDANPFRDGDDLWLYVKTDGNCCGVPTGIVAQRLSADGLSLTGEPHLVSGVINDMPWEGGVVEATQMIKRGPIYWMFYAGNDYSNEKYATGYAMCKTPIGPCLDAKENPILQSEPGNPPLTGPGHQSLFEIDGDMWIAYHGWLGSDADRNRRRVMYIDLVDWSTGLPVIVAR